MRELSQKVKEKKGNVKSILPIEDMNEVPHNE